MCPGFYSGILEGYNDERQHAARSDPEQDVLTLTHREAKLKPQRINRYPDRGKMNVRKMLVSDIPDVAQAHRMAWQIAYRVILSDALLDSLSQAEFERNWQGILQRPNRATLVAESKGRAIGYVAFGPDPDSTKDSACGEIIGLYVHPDHWGHGAGGRLISEALAQLGQHGFTAAIVWAMRDNERACRFYQQHGFCLDGRNREAECRGETFTEVRLSREIGARPASALILARSAQFRESLAVLIRAIPQIAHISQAEDLSSALRENPGTPPDLMLCDFESVQDEAAKALRSVKSFWPHVRCVVLVEDETAYLQAKTIGADVVLTKGVLAAKLLQAIEELLAA
jgi:GNAT superfamily N-acetyltransferase